MQMQIIVDRFLRSDNSHQYDLNAFDRVLLFILASYIATGDNCFPSIKRLIDDCGMSKNTIIRSIKKLESLHLIRVTRYSNNNNVYEIILNAVPDRDHAVPGGDHVVSHRDHEVPNRDPNNINNNISNNINNNITSFSQNNGSPLLQEWEASRQKQP